MMFLCSSSLSFRSSCELLGKTLVLSSAIRVMMFSVYLLQRLFVYVVRWVSRKMTCRSDWSHYVCFVAKGSEEAKCLCLCFILRKGKKSGRLHASLHHCPYLCLYLPLPRIYHQWSWHAFCPGIYTSALITAHSRRSLSLYLFSLRCPRLGEGEM